MRKTALVAAMLAILSYPAPASDFTMMASGTKFTADWTNVTACANKPYPKLPDSDARLYQMAEHYFHSISACRWAMVTRHAVWIEAGRAEKDDPFPPVSIDNPDDFKRDLVCDYSGLDERGMGRVRCNADKW